MERGEPENLHKDYIPRIIYIPVVQFDVLRDDSIQD